ncbi:sodium:proton antiporter [Devosia sp. 2618]|uniref:cation:proton antiporter n=1 Tax=Devosia sp. 2618 TaxID=3156454 RepID=UPI0033925208
MFAHILIVIIAAIAISAFAERRNIQPAILVAMVGLAASFIPGVPRLELEPEIILGIVLPPMLFSAASDFSFTSFARRLGSIVNLGVFMVFAATAAVGVVAAGVVPELTLPAALVLAAVLAPPDAVTAITIGRKAGLPTGLMTVLKGESLINDAAALTIFAAAVAAVAGTHAFIDNLPIYFLYSSVVGVLLGLIIGNFAQFVRRRLGNPSLSTVVSVIVPFAAYLVAEELHASGVLAVVTAGFAIGHHAVESGYEERMQEREFWRTADTLLETFVFAYIGLQLRFVITDAEEAGIDLPTLLFAATAVFLATVAVRFIWVFGTALVGRWRYRATQRRWVEYKAALARGDDPFERRGRTARADRPDAPARRRPQLEPPQRPLSWKENVVLSWTGMRGVVTLAAAAGVPAVTATGLDFPGREAILAIAFLVTIATLLIQGLSLPWLIKHLDLNDPRAEKYLADQEDLARKLANEATAQALAEYREANDTPTARRVAEVMARRNKLTTEAEHTGRNFDQDEAFELSKTLLAAKRKRLIAARDARELDETVLRDVLEHMDLEQAFMDTRDRTV